MCVLIFHLSFLVGCTHIFYKKWKINYLLRWLITQKIDCWMANFTLKAFNCHWEIKFSHTCWLRKLYLLKGFPLPFLDRVIYLIVNFILKSLHHSVTSFKSSFFFPLSTLKAIYKTTHTERLTIYIIILRK